MHVLVEAPRPYLHHDHDHDTRGRVRRVEGKRRAISASPSTPAPARAPVRQLFHSSRSAVHVLPRRATLVVCVCSGARASLALAVRDHGRCICHDVAVFMFAPSRSLRRAYVCLLSLESANGEKFVRGLPKGAQGGEGGPTRGRASARARRKAMARSPRAGASWSWRRHRRSWITDLPLSPRLRALAPITVLSIPHSTLRASREGKGDAR